ncbi:MAG: flagellar export chaperone FliS [Pseudomonadota bacterium]
MYENAVKSYQQVNFITANPAKLILMCYEGAICSLKLARESYAAKEYEVKGKALQKTLDIIHELNASLDMQKGGKIAVNLRSLYAYMTQALVEADLKKNLSVFDDVIRMLMELESAWQEISCGSYGNATPIPQGMPKVAGESAVIGRAWSA